MHTGQGPRVPRLRRALRRAAALVLGCGAAGLAVGWRYAERRPNGQAG